MADVGGTPLGGLGFPSLQSRPIYPAVLSHSPAEAGAGGTWVSGELLGGCPCPHFHPRAASLGTAPGCGSCKDGSASSFTTGPIRLQSEHAAFYLSFPTQLIPEDLSLPNPGADVSLSLLRCWTPAFQVSIPATFPPHCSCSLLRSHLIFWLSLGGDT